MDPQGFPFVTKKSRERKGFLTACWNVQAVGEALEIAAEPNRRKGYALRKSTLQRQV
jgi:hypothetical protein